MYPEEKMKEVADVGRVGNRLPIAHQEKAITEVHETISMLEERLIAVLTPVPEADEAGNMTEERVSQSPLGEQIGVNNSSIARASRRLRSIMERLEC
jgi:hypothetical protein